MPKDFGAICLYALYDIETQRRPNNSRWVQSVGKNKIISCFQRFLHFIWCAIFWLLFELDTFASTYSRDLLPHARGANGFRDRGHVVQSFLARWRQADISSLLKTHLKFQVCSLWWQRRHRRSSPVHCHRKDSRCSTRSFRRVRKPLPDISCCQRPSHQLKSIKITDDRLNFSWQRILRTGLAADLRHQRYAPIGQ